MQLLEFMVPVLFNDGRKIDHADFDAWLGDRYTGYTKLAPAVGYWRDGGGQVYQETVIPYRVATDEIGADKTIADRIARSFDQVAVYVGRIGTADIVVYNQ